MFTMRGPIPGLQSGRLNRTSEAHSCCNDELVQPHQTNREKKTHRCEINSWKKFQASLVTRKIGLRNHNGT